MPQPELIDPDFAEAVGVAAVSRSYRFNAQRFAARRRGLSWNLEPDQFRRLTESACHYCGSPPANTAQISAFGHRFRLRYQGIDRVDNGRGYEPDNVVPCCPSCNAAKGTKTAKAFREWAKRLAERAL